MQISLLGLNFGRQFLDLAEVQVVDDDRNAFTAARRHQLGSFLDRFRPAGVISVRQARHPLLIGPRLGAGRRARAAPRTVNRRAGFAKCKRDASSYSASSAGHEHHAFA